MDNVGHEPVNETAARRVGSTKARRGRSRKNSAHENVVQKPNSVRENVVQAPNNVHENAAQEPNHAHEPAAGETLTPARSLLLAALRVWELKHRIGE